MAHEPNLPDVNDIGSLLPVENVVFAKIAVHKAAFIMQDTHRFDDAPVAFGPGCGGELGVLG